MSEVGCSARSSENTTSSALKALPLWNLTPWRSLNSQTVGSSSLIFHDSGQRRQQLAGGVAQDQRLVDLVQQVVGRPLVLRMRVERQRIARAGPFDGARIGRAGGQHEAEQDALRSFRGIVR